MKIRLVDSFESKIVKTLPGFKMEAKEALHSKRLRMVNVLIGDYIMEINKFIHKTKITQTEAKSVIKAGEEISKISENLIKTLKPKAVNVLEGEIAHLTNMIKQFKNQIATLRLQAHK